MSERVYNDSVDFVHRLTLDSNYSDEEDESFDSASPCKPVRGLQSTRQTPVLTDVSNRMNSLSSYSLSAAIKGTGQKSPSRDAVYPTLPRPTRPAFNIYPSPVQSPTTSIQSFASLISSTSATTAASELDSDIGTEIDTDLDDECDNTIVNLPAADPSRDDISFDFRMPLLAEKVSRPYCTRHSVKSSRDAYPLYHRANNSVVGIPLSQYRLNKHENQENLAGNEACYPSADAETISIGSTRPVSTRNGVWMPCAKVRRTQSMFATPEQMLHEQQLGNMERSLVGGPRTHSLSLLGNDEISIETFSVRQDPFLRINHETLRKLMDKEHGHMYDEVFVIDCRFEYEYEGGHIDGAINVNSKQQLETTFFKKEVCETPSKKLLVFYCEYSAYRSPMLASHLRNCDRSINSAHYPYLYYPDVVVLDGGYKEFYSEAAHRCVPQNYVGMNHQAHQNTCEREMSRFRNGMKARKFRSFGMASSPHLAGFKFPETDFTSHKSASVSDLTQTSPLTFPNASSRSLLLSNANMFGPNM